MLRLLQKKNRNERYDFLAHLFFVGMVHGCIALVFFIGSATESLSLKISAVKPHQAIIVWHTTRSASKKKSITAQPPKKNRPINQQIHKPAPAAPLFSKINLGPKKTKAKSLLTKKDDKKKADPTKSNVNDKKEVTKHIEEISSPTDAIRMNIHDYDRQHDMWEIIDAVQRWWQPPFGVDDGIECIIHIVFTSSGAIKDLVVEKSSGIPVYDIAAKSALLKAVFSKKVWGKQWVFHF